MLADLLKLNAVAATGNGDPLQAWLRNARRLATNPGHQKFLDGLLGDEAPILTLDWTSVLCVAGQPESEQAAGHHSDRGSQYASADFRRALEGFGMKASMSRKGGYWDNAAAESFFATLKTELIHRRPWPIRAAKKAIDRYIAGFYNSRRGVVHT